jgi:phosphohistidine swiveling domain-containing protein
MTSWQDERKKYILLGIDSLEILIKELSARIQIPIELLRYSSPDEICGKKEINQEILENRRRNGVLFTSRPPKNAEKEFENTEIMTGEEYNEAIKLLKKEQEIEKQSINGSPASLGYVIGKARVILHPENAEFEKGEVLVTGMTRPEFLPLMKKASAIVTDEGGITSHAAIVARELNIPCIIGTKIATKAIKTGDTIEVKANHGIVKILERR